MIDISTPQSPGWWLARLLKELEGRQERLHRLDRYYQGDPDLPHVNEATKDAYRRFQRKARTNFAELIVEAVRERMSPLGFRTGAAKDETGDDAAWQIWQANSLDADSAFVHQAMLSMSDAYVIVGQVDADIGAPLITPEDPRQVITAHDPMRRRKVIAALKTFHDEDAEVDRAYVYLPGEVWQATRTSKRQWGGWTVGNFDWVEDAPGKLPFQTVPVIRFANRSKLMGPPSGEFEGSIDTLDRINFMLLQRLMIAALQAFKQRGIKGIPQTDAKGNAIDYADIFRSDPGALWQLPDTAEIWESGQTDIQGILNAVKADVMDLAAVTRTPLFYLTPDAANGSAEGASLAREGLIFKTFDRLAQAGESWEQVMSLAFTIMGDKERAARSDMEIIWDSPNRYTLSEQYSAAVQAVTAGVPWETRMTLLQFSPQEIERMKAERASDALEAALTPPPPTTTRLTETELIVDPNNPAKGAKPSAPAATPAAPATPPPTPPPPS